MKKFAVLPIAALLLAACSESPVGVDMAPQFSANHTRIDKPTIQYATPATGGASVAWTWNDTDTWDLVSFTVKLNGANTGISVPNVKPFTPTILPVSRSLMVAGAEIGDQICVEVMAKNQKRPPTVTHHSFECATVALQSVSYTFKPILDANSPDLQTSLELSATGSVTVWAFLYKNNARVTDCDEFALSAAEARATWTTPDHGSTDWTAAVKCESNQHTGYRYEFQLTNIHNNNKVTAAGSISFRVNGAAAGTYDFTMPAK